MLVLSVALTLALFAGQAYAQEQTVEGTVTDAETQEPLPGVNVLVSDTDIGTATGTDGTYSLNVPAEADTLVFSYVGYQVQRVPIDGRSVIDVELAPSVQELQDIVVTAFGVERDTRELGYAVQRVEAEDLSQTDVGNLVTGLSGRVAGAQIVNTGGAPGQSARIILRGVNSLDPGADNQPLFVVDGIPIDNSTDPGAEGFDSRGFSNRAVDLNPNDIESVSVLKGSAATALYGVRAANGAVIITTKRGSPGDIQVNFTSSASAEQPNRLPDVQQQYAQGFAGEYDPESFWCCWGAPREEALQENPDLEFYNNWERAYETGYELNNNINLSGGSETAAFYASLEHLRNEGTMPFSDWDRTSVRLSGNLQAADNLNFSGSLNYVNSGGHRVFADRFNERIVYWTVNQDVTDYRKANGTMMGYYGSDDNVGTNPIYDARYAAYEDDVNRLIGNLSVDYDVAPWANVTYRIGMDYYGDFRDQHTQGPQGIEGENPLSSTGDVGETRIFNRDITSTLNLTLSRDITDALSGELILGNDIFNRSYNRVFASGEELVIPNFYHLSNVRNQSSTQTIRQRRLIGVYGDLTLNYDDMVYLEVTGRNDWSSTLPEESRSFFYPSVNLSYVFTESLEAPDFLNYGRLRASWAQVGKDAPPYATSITFTSPSEFPLNGQTGFTRSGELGSPDLKPERTTTIELGGNLQFFDNRLGLDATWYRSNSVDQIIPVPISNTTGFSTFVTNAGEIENRGIELSLNGTVVQSEDFGWDVTLNFARNRNEVVSIREGIEQIDLGSQFGYAGSTAYLRLIEGVPYGTIFGTSYARYYESEEDEDPLYVDEDRPILIGEDGFPVIERDLKILGNMTPDWESGIQNTLTYRNFELSALVDVSYGAEKYNQYNNFFAAFGIAKYTLDRDETVVFEGVTADGSPNTQEVWLGQGIGPDNRDYGAGYYRNTYRASTENSVMDASYVKLRNISFAYRLPGDFLSRMGVRNARVAVAASNILLWSPYEFWDPEVTTSGAESNTTGFSGLAHPGVSSYTLTFEIGL